MVPWPGAFKSKVIVFILHNFPIVVHLSSDGKLPSPQGDKTGSAPTTEAWRKGPSLREVVGAKYASVYL
jgi:hypothetical protein